jgi:hypothetical protein
LKSYIKVGCGQDASSAASDFDDLERTGAKDSRKKQGDPATDGTMQVVRHGTNGTIGSHSGDLCAGRSPAPAFVEDSLNFVAVSTVFPYLFQQLLCDGFWLAPGL